MNPVNYDFVGNAGKARRVGSPHHITVYFCIRHENHHRTEFGLGISQTNYDFCTCLAGVRVFHHHLSLARQFPGICGQRDKVRNDFGMVLPNTAPMIAVSAHHDLLLPLRLKQGLYQVAIIEIIMRRCWGDI